MSLDEAAENFGARPEALNTWVEEELVRRDGESPEEERERLLRTRKRLETEIAILKKADEYFSKKSSSD